MKPYNISYLLLCLICWSASIQAQPANWGNNNRWESLNPGGGGQIQDVYFDRNVEGRIWFSSDMEAVYRSDDFGQSWNFVSTDLSHGMAFVMAQEEGGNRLYQGGLYGAHVSTNSGASDYHQVTWDIIEETRGDAIASIAISSDRNTVVLAPGWQNKDPQKGQGSIIDPIQNLTTDKFNGPRNVYISTDRGQTFSTVNYYGTPGYRNVFGVAIHPTNDNIYIGSAAGVFVSTNGGTSFSQISKPSQALGPAGDATSITKRPDGGCRGVSLSPDGQHIYAVYQTVSATNYADKRWAVFVAKTSSSGISGGWTMIMNGLSDQSEWYDPKVDPRSSATAHRVLIGTVWNSNQNRVGLWEANVTFNGSGAVTSHNWGQVLDLPKSGRCYTFEPSWERRDFIVRSFDYTPASWNAHKIIAMGGMNVFLTDATGPGYPCDSWQEVYGEVISYQDGLAFSHERGFSSPYCYDVDAYQNYMIQGCADHGMLQSLDNGYSWTSEHGPQGITNTMSVLTIPTNPPLVLADCRKGFGAPSQSVGGLYAKQIDLNTIGDTPDWILIGGAVPNATGTTRGLPSRNYRAMTHDPNQPKRVYVTMRGKNWGGETIQGGMYVADDIVAVFNGTQNWRKINDAGMDFRDLRDVWVDPNNSNYVYARSAGSGSGASIYRGVRQGNGSYTWTNMEADCQDATDMYVWEKDGQTMMAVSAKIDNVYGVHICTNPRGASWNTIASWDFTGMDVAKTLQLKPEKWIETNEPITIRGLAAYEDKIVVLSEVSNHKKGLGAFLGQIQSNGTVNWSNWTKATGNNRIIENPTSLQAKVKTENGKQYYYVALAGTGPWRRQLSAVASCLTLSKTNHSFSENAGSTTVNVTTSSSWSASDDASWITTSKSGNTLTITVTANTGSDARTGTVTISGCETQAVSITQAGDSSPPPGGGSGGMEDFANLPTLNDWSTGSFTGNDGITWSYNTIKRTTTINGNTVKLDNSANAYVSADLSGGLQSVTFWAAPTGTANPSGVEVYVDGNLEATFTIAAGAAPQSFTVNNIGASGTSELKFMGAGNADAQIDDISWTVSSGGAQTYTLTVNNGSGDGDYEAGETITITADAPPAGKQFDQWTGAVSNLDNANNATATVTMPSNGITLSATYEDIPSGGGSGGMEDFANLPTLNDWSTGSFTGNDGISWSYNTIKRTTTINGNTVKLDNSANAYVAADLSGGLQSVTFWAAPTGTANPSGVEVYVAGTLEASFTIAAGAAPQSFTVSNIGATGTVELKFMGTGNSDAQIDDISWTVASGGGSPQTYTLTVNNGSGGGSYEAGETITITADAPPAGKQFDQWTGAVNNLDNANNATATVTMPSNGITLSATYEDIPAGGGGGMEDFTNLQTLNQWSDGSFVGNDGITWNYVQVKRTSTINGNTIKLDNSANASVSANISGGIGSVTFKAAPTGTANSSGVEVWIDGVSEGTFTIAANSGTNTFSLNNINESGTVELTFTGINNSDAQIDDISWTGYGSGSRTVAPSEMEIAIYPNPVDDILTIQSREELPVVIYTLSGQEVLRHHTSISRKLDMSEIQSGIYVVQVGTQFFKVSKH
ncbi:InlB B-repeat-containing protein [Pontibacter sp. G13]|uniref:InlB B-repeat-containing protein n=1 Tax=Pontibacter sp. G13 TaxID=3074898 RepID=UPI00288AA962|nr:BACON domain-containing carbohydrate-binding protein [Pontibacter sp. G13]WNJ18706.1 T9SS type A sorting domain-containing protein [Pontibacter sp. G13]